MHCQRLILFNNPDLTKAQIDELQKALPNCKIQSNPTKFLPDYDWLRRK
jgi:hypothetical protein